ncbi:MAG: NERD domain-containing protein/DEAD/DEAH box helicase [Deltaproteobacteria bacterium]|nr:NERD domain-containing protein/DEAD/DEAH box helicase [Deltaproteobacteria bacterium]
MSPANLLGLWPREIPRQTKSEAERRVYDALKISLPNGWHAWHSLKLRTKAKGEFSEADFIIADPDRPSLLILEVKGGQIAQHDGHWQQNNLPLKEPPLDQAFNFRRQLIDRFKEDNIEPPTIGVAACFPDTFFSQQPAQDDLQGLIIGGQDLPYLDKVLKDVMERAVPDPWPVKGPWIKALHDFWGETWVPRLRLGDRIHLDTDHRIQLDKEQLERLDEIDENDHVLIRGGAGTGKTLLAREAALRHAAKGKKVLLLCFTDALGNWLKETIRHPNITPAAIRQFAARLLGENSSRMLSADISEYWNTVSLRAAIDGLPTENDLWDSVIVDEGQDFSEEDWELVQECTRKTGRLWVFSDEGQAFWGNRKIPEGIEHKSSKIRLHKPYRCPPEIQNLTDCYAGRCQVDLQLVKTGIQADIIRLVTCSEQRVAKQVGKEINRLLGEGLQPSEIAVLSVRGRGAVENICHIGELGGNKVVLATNQEADSHIIFDTFLRFKGLERPAVIVTDLRLVSDLYETRMHIAVSRPTSLLRIVGVEKEMRKDLRLAGLI